MCIYIYIYKASFPLPLTCAHRLEGTTLANRLAASRKSHIKRFMCRCISVCMYVYIYIYICICTRKQLYIYINIYTHR